MIRAAAKPEISGLLLVGLGAIAGLGIYADAAGPVGRLLTEGFGLLIGILRFAAPVVLVSAGLLLVRGGDRGSGSAVRPTVAAIALVTALAAFAHVTLDDPARTDQLDRLANGGGGLGWLVGRPLVAVVTAVGAGVLLALVVVALLFSLASLTPRQFLNGVRRTTAPAVTAFRNWLRALFEPAEDDGSDATPLFDQDADARPRRTRRPATAPTTSAETAPLDDTAAARTFTPAAEETPTPAPTPAPVEVRLPAPPPDPDTLDLDRPATAVVTGAAGANQPEGWKLPPMKLLELSGAQEIDRSLVERAGRTLEHALAEHGVETRLVGMVVGPTVTRYELELGPGVKVARVTSLHKDIAYAMATPDVRILAPIPGRQAIGVEVPNAKRQLVTVGDILASEEARRADHPLEVAIGRDIAGRSVLANLSKMPHVLIAGATGAGKSSCINSLLTSILMRSTPDEVRLILIDPKRVELGQYNRLPHLLTQVVTNPKKAANALNWAVREMERRYDLLSEVGVRDITGYNAAYDRGDLQGEESEILRKALGHLPEVDLHFPRLPYILVVVDELNDLMMVAARDVEDSICRIAQMARAVGIHLVLATQRPSVNVITGVIKANIPARLAFAVSSLADSRVILDQQGAERLVGRGDMLILDGSTSTAQRLQGAWVTEDEVRAVAAFWRRQAPEVAYVEGVEGSDDGDQLDLFSAMGSSGDEDDDELFRQARELVVRSQFGSTSMLQRKLRVGFARAGRLMDLLEQAGVVGPSTGSKAREVLMTPEELDETTGVGR